MEGRLQRRIQRYGWDKAAASYEAFWQHQLRPAQDRLLEMATLRPGERVLEVACGTGLVTFRAAEAVGAEGDVVATDISRVMVEMAQEVAAKRGVENVSFERMGAEELRLPDESFDVALCALGLMYVPDVRKALEEEHRLLKNGGRAIVAVWGQRDRCGWAEIFPITDACVESEVCPMFFQMGTKEVLKLTFEAAGFVDVLLERLPSLLRYESADDALGAAFMGGPVALAYARFDERTRDEVHAEYLASIEPFREGDGYDVPGEFVIVAGRKR